VVELKRIFMFCLEDWGAWAFWVPLIYATGQDARRSEKILSSGVVGYTNKGQEFAIF